MNSKTNPVVGKKAHAKFSASGAERWLSCPASIKLSIGVPPAPDSKYAIEGTEAHHCVETLLANTETRYTTKRKLEKTYPKEMVEHAFKAAETILDMVPKGCVELLSEVKIELPGVGFGTVDAAIVEHFGRLQVIDFKYGAGRIVDPKQNPQLIYYALGIAKKYDFNFQDVELVILQPRGKSKAGPIRRWVMSVDELMGWEKIFLKGVSACNGKNPSVNEGSWCHYCPANQWGNITCPKKTETLFTKAVEQFTAIPIEGNKVSKQKTKRNRKNGKNKIYKK